MSKKLVNYLNSWLLGQFLVLLILYVSIDCQSQNKSNSIYFISGCIYDNIPGEFDSYLYKYLGDSLEIIAQLSNDSTHLRFIKAYHELNSIVILKDGYIYNDNCTLQIISMKNPEIKNLIDLGNKNNLAMENMVKVNNTPYYIFYIRSKQIFKGLNIFDRSISEFNDNVLQNSIIGGSVGGALSIYTMDYQSLKIDKTEKELIIPTLNMSNNKVKYPIEIPEKYLIKNKKYYALEENNDSYTIFWLNKSSINKSKRLGWNKLLIYDKDLKKWNIKKIKGNNSFFIAFGDFIAGWIVQSYDEGEFNTNNYISPGQQNRKKNTNELGFTFDERALDIGIYFPGILYVYNIKTYKYVEWNTKQGDSEILLIENGIIYYRVGNGIYQRTLSDSFKLGIPKLLMKNDIVFDVHWMFVSD